MELEMSHDELDLPPEYCHYRDEGCEFADSCLHCSLPKCIYDEPGGRQRWRKGQRNGEIARLFYGEGKGIKELTSMFSISQRTVQRALKAHLLGSSSAGAKKVLERKRNGCRL